MPKQFKDKSEGSLEILVGRSLLERLEGRRLADEVVEELARKRYEKRHILKDLGSEVTGFLKNGALSTSAGAAVGYFTGGQEGVVIGAKYGFAVYGAFNALIGTLRFLLKNRFSGYEKVAEKLKRGVNSSIRTNVTFVSEPLQSLVGMALVSCGVMAGSAYALDTFSSSIPLIREVVEQAKENGVSAAGIGLLFGPLAFARGYLEATVSNAKLKRKFEKVANRDELENPNLDALLGDEPTYSAAVSKLGKIVDDEILETQRGKRFGENFVSSIVKRYYNESVRPQSILKTGFGFVKKAAFISAAGAAIGYLADGSESAVAGAEYGASIFAMVYAVVNSLAVFKAKSQRTSLEKAIEGCRKEVPKTIENAIKTYKGPIGSAVPLILGLAGLFVGASYLHDKIGTHIPVIEDIIANAQDSGVSTFKMGLVIGTGIFVMEYRQALRFARAVYQGIDKAVFTDRPEKARVSRGSAYDLDKFIRVNSAGILETPVIEYENRRGKKVTFIGAVHMGEKEYFAKLQDILDQHEKVFYEFVKERKGEFLSRISGGRFLVRGFGGYKRLKRNYHLAYQGDEIDYGKPNWENVDVEAQDVIRRINRADSIAGAVTKQMLMYTGGLLLRGVSYLATNVFYIPKSKLTERLAADRKPGLFDDTVIYHRNNVVKNKLAEFIEGPGENAAVFYGAGHLRDLHDHMVNNLDFRVRRVHWLEAW